MILNLLHHPHMYKNVVYTISECVNINPTLNSIPRSLKEWQQSAFGNQKNEFVDLVSFCILRNTIAILCKIISQMYRLCPFAPVYMLYQKILQLRCTQTDRQKVDNIIFEVKWYVCGQIVVSPTIYEISKWQKILFFEKYNLFPMEFQTKWGRAYFPCSGFRQLIFIET